MFAHKCKYGLFLFTITVLVSCTNKDLPQGTRISVLPLENISEKYVSAENGDVSLPEAKNYVEWSQNGGNSNHLSGNISAKHSVKEAFRLKYGAPAGKRDMLISEPVVVGGFIITIDADAKISAFNFNNGDLVWETEVFNDKSISSFKAGGLAANSEKVFAATGDGEVAAFNLKNGQELWRHKVGTPIRIAPTASARRVFVQTIDNRLVALDALSGEEIWNYEIMQEDTTLLGGASPAYDEDQDIVVAAFSSGDLQAIKASTGSPLWNSVLVSNRYAGAQSSISAIKANPVIDGDTVFAIGNSKTLAAIDSITGERLWDKQISGFYQPIVSGEYIFVLSNDNYLSAINKNNGQTLWSKKLDLTNEGKEIAGLLALRPIMVDGYIIVAVSDGKIFKINAKNGNVAKVFELGEDLLVAPIVVNGSFIFTTADAKLIVYR